MSPVGDFLLLSGLTAIENKNLSMAVYEMYFVLRYAL